MAKKKLGRAKRYAIHYCIVALLALIPSIWSIDTAYKLYKGELPKYNYEVVASGEIQRKIIDGNSYFFMIDDNKILVNKESFKKHTDGETVVLSNKYESGASDMRIFFSALVWLCMAIAAVCCVIHLIDLYFKWLKGE